MGRCGGGAADRVRSDRARRPGGGGLSGTGAWRLAAAAGLAALLASRGFAMIPGIGACGGAAPILSLEFAPDIGAARALLADPLCPPAQRTGLWLDMLAFIPAYLFFVLLVAAALMRAAPFAMRVAGIAIIAAAAGDVVENVLLFRVLRDAPISFALLGGVVHAKFALIALAEAIAGAVLLLRGGWPGRIAGALAVAGAVTSAIMLVVDPLHRAMFSGSAVALMALWALSLIAAIRPALALPRSRG